MVSLLLVEGTFSEGGATGTTIDGGNIDTGTIDKIY